MNDREIDAKVQNSMYHQCQKRGYAIAVDVLIDLGFLKKSIMRIGDMAAFPFLRGFAMSISASCLPFSMKCACMREGPI